MVIGEISLVRTAHYVYLGSIAYSVRHSRQRLLALSAAAIHLQHTAVLPETQTALLHHTVQFPSVHPYLHGILARSAVYHSTEISRQTRYSQVRLHFHLIRSVVVSAKLVLAVHPHLHVQRRIVSGRQVLLRTVGTQPCHNLLVRVCILLNLIQTVSLAVFEDVACRQSRRSHKHLSISHYEVHVKLRVHQGKSLPYRQFLYAHTCRGYGVVLYAGLATVCLHLASIHLLPSVSHTATLLASRPVS